MAPSNLPVGRPVAFFSVSARARLMAFLAVTLVVKTYSPNSDSRGTRARSRILLRTDRIRHVMGYRLGGEWDGIVTATLLRRFVSPMAALRVTEWTSSEGVNAPLCG